MANNIKYKGKIYIHHFAYSGKNLSKVKDLAKSDGEKLKLKGYLIKIEKKSLMMKVGVSPKYKKFTFYSLYKRKK